MADNKLRPPECVASDVVKHYKANEIPESVAVIEVRDLEMMEEICAFIKRWATTPGRNGSIYTAHELERAIRAEFGGKPNA